MSEPSQTPCLRFWRYPDGVIQLNEGIAMAVGAASGLLLLLGMGPPWWVSVGLVVIAVLAMLRVAWRSRTTVQKQDGSVTVRVGWFGGGSPILEVGLDTLEQAYAQKLVAREWRRYGRPSRGPPQISWRVETVDTFGYTELFLDSIRRKEVADGIVQLLRSEMPS